MTSPAPAIHHRGPPDQSARTARDGVERRLVGLDGLRFGAAFFVLLHHYTARWSTAWGRPPEEVFPVFTHVTAYGVIGPEQFFTISGFVILMTAWGRDVAHVVASRVARLFPAYWVAVLLTSFLLMVLWPRGKDISLGEAAVNLTMLQELFGVRHVDGVYWTLWVELRFYVLVALFVALGVTRRRILVVCAVWPPVAILTADRSIEPFATLLLGGYAPYFAGGMLLYLIYREGHALTPWLLVLGNVLLALPGSVPRLASMIERNTGTTPSSTLLAVLVVCCFVTVVVLVLTPLKDRGGEWLVALGWLTYPLYLLHEFWGWWFISLAYPTLGRWETLTVATVLAVGLAAVVHHGVEKPLGPRLRALLVKALGRKRGDVVPSPVRGTDREGGDSV